MRTLIRVVAIVLFGALAAAASAAHITDKLVVGMYPQPSPEGSPLKLLSSGTPIEVLQQKDGYTQVRLADDTEGWVASSYVTEEKPAKAMLLETQARLRQMGIELAALREQQAAAGEAEAAAQDRAQSEREIELSEALSEAETRVAELEKQLVDRSADEPGQPFGELQERVNRAVSLLSGGQETDIGGILQLGHDNPLIRYRYWIIGGVAALLGFIAGVAFIDYRFRRRHGGFRF
jgi:SH3 domain protein